MTYKRPQTYYAVVTPAELVKELEKGKFRPVYYFYGSEEYRIKEAEKAVAGRYLPKSLLKTNHTVLSASKQKITDIINELSIYPMLGENQVFTIADIQSLQPKDVEKILGLLSPADPNRIIIMTTPPAKAPRKNSKMLNLLSKKAAAVEFNRISGDRSARKIKAMLSEKQIEIEREALDMLVTLGGGDMGGLIQEVEKLIDYVGETKKIGREDVAAVCTDYQVCKIYELADRVALQELDRALEIIAFLLKKGETPSGITFWLSEHFIDLYLTKNNKPLPPYKQRMGWKYDKQAGIFTNERLEEIIKLIAETDVALRSNLKSERVILEKLIFNICLAEENAPDA